MQDNENQHSVINTVEKTLNMVNTIRLFVVGWKVALVIFLIVLFIIVIEILALPFSKADVFERINENEKNLAYISTAELFGYEWQLLIAKDIALYENDISKADPLESMLELTTVTEYIKTKTVKKNLDGTNSSDTKIQENSYQGGNIIVGLKSILSRDIQYTAEDIGKALTECPDTYSKISKKTIGNTTITKSRKVVVSYVETSEDIIAKYFSNDEDSAARFTMIYTSGVLEDYIQPYVEYDLILSPDLMRKITGFFSSPVDNYSVTSPFGNRVHPILKTIKLHTGVDLVSADRRIYAAATGTVVSAGPNGTYGNYIKIKHIADGSTFYTAYGHLAKIFVKKGQEVKQTTVIGQMGSTGRSTGIHLHFEIIDSSGNPINPMPIIESGKIQ